MPPHFTLLLSRSGGRRSPAVASSRAAAALARHMRPHILHMDEDYLSGIFNAEHDTGGREPGRSSGRGRGVWRFRFFGGGGGVFGPEGEGSAEDFEAKNPAVLTRAF